MLIVASAGNHGEAAAAVGSQLGLKTEVLVGKDASHEKRRLIKTHGAEVVVKDSLELALEEAEDYRTKEGVLVVHPYNDLDVLAGQSIMGVQLVEDLYAQGITGKVVVQAPVGGGGFLSGLVIGSRFAQEWAAAEDCNLPFELEFVGVQMEGGDPARRAVDKYRAGLSHTMLGDLYQDEKPDKTNDGTFAVPGELTLAVLSDRSLVSDIQLVSAVQVGQAMADLTRRHNKQIEPAGSLSHAGAVQWAKGHATSPLAKDGVTLVTYTTGANVTPEHYMYFEGLVKEHNQKLEMERKADVDAYRQRLRSYNPGRKAVAAEVHVAADVWNGVTSIASSPTATYRMAPSVAASRR